MNYVLRLKRIVKSSIENSFYYYIILLLVFIVGTITGSLLVNILSDNINLKLIDFASPYLRFNLNALEYFKNSIIFNVVFLGLNLIFGLLNLGIVSGLFIFMRGNLLGLTVGFIIQSKGIKGFILSIFSVYPQHIIYLPCMLLVGVLSILVNKRTNLINRKKYNSVILSSFDYVILLVLIFILMTTGSFYEGFISPIFFKL